MTPQLEDLISFARSLREQGLSVGTARVLAFCRAVAALGPASREDLYWAGRTTLIASAGEVEVFDAAFRSFFDSTSRDGVDAEQMEAASGTTKAAGPDAIHGTREPVMSTPGTDRENEPEGEMGSGIVASAAELLRTKSFDTLSEAERIQTSALIRRLAVDIPRRRTRRLRSSRKGIQLDLRRTLRYSLRTQGEAIRRALRRRRTRRRSLVLILDVSGSMAPYSRALVQFGFAALAAGHKVEVFCFGTRLTRVTKALRGKDPNRAMKDVGAMVGDWEGGTRIGDSFRELLKAYGQRDFIRGSVVVVCSDGLERGNPEVLKTQIARLRRVAHRLVWVNPLKGSPEYAPLARGMAAALPHVDRFLPGHNVASLEELGAVLAE